MTTCPKLDDLYEIAMNEGAALVELWYIKGCGPTYVVVTDEGHWSFRDNVEHSITEADARALLELFFIGYAY